ncbi:hypothetical protein QKC54_gp0068 [Megavirus baoshan]|uniref:Uncharacterized protein n=1 Tax=Megavirus baoshan TaxID=2496520 RepID=A0A3Q8U8T2_9VIRU|nr:hypothetical protein QKC54_gp0068 [Megavirus baoshan]AZL89839.1 hypothetical protein Mb1004 [Megavirus baoshan]
MNSHNLDSEIIFDQDFYYCGEKKYIYCDKNTFIRIKNDPFEKKLAILDVISFIIEIKSKILGIKKLKNETETKLVKLQIDSDENYRSEIMINLTNIIEKYNGNIKDYENDLNELNDFKKKLLT